MKKLAIALALTVVFAYPSASGATDGASEPAKPAATTKTAAGGDQSTSTDTNGAKEKHQKISHKHNKQHHENENEVGDGSSLGSLGARKKVDSGFDFDNSKTFHQTGN